MSQTIAPLDILTSGGKYPEREKSDECTTAVRVAAADLAERVTKLVDSIGHVPSISSGFRTLAVNTAVGGSSHSAHLAGQAVDLHDPDGALARQITTALLGQFDLYQENPQYTKGWVHLQTKRTDSGARIFRITP